MKNNSIGKDFVITCFGESHGKCVGVVIDGCPAGLELSEHYIQKEVNRRIPPKPEIVSARQEKDVVEIQLREYEIISREADKIEITFGKGENMLKTSFDVLEDRLEIKFSSKNSELNRFWMRIQANEGEAIYGCGEQFSEVNLRGKKVPEK